MVLPKRTALALSRQYPIRILPTRTQAAADHPRLIWHDITHSDPLMQWLRGQFLVAAKESDSLAGGLASAGRS